MKNQSGFAILEGALIVVVIVGLVGGGYVVWQRQHPTSTATSSSTGTGAPALNYNSPAVTTPSAPTVTNATGLDSAMQALNETNVSAGSTDSSQLGTQASGL